MPFREGRGRAYDAANPCSTTPMNDGNEKDKLEEGFWVGDWFVEPMLNRAIKEEEHVQLEPKVMDVLQLMAERPGKAVTKEEFMNQVWTDTVVTDDVLSRCISQLRKVFGDDARDPDYIETIRKTGYRLIAPVRVPDTEKTSAVAEQEAEDVEDASSDEHLEGTKQRLFQDLDSMTSAARDDWVVVAGGVIKRRWVLAIAALVVVVGVSLGVGLFMYPISLSSSSSANPLGAVPLTSFSGRELEPSMSPDGRQVAFTWEGEENGARNVYLIQKGANTPLRLTNSEHDEWDPTWSPDGQYVAFVRAVGGGSGVFMVSSIGGSERQIANFPDRHVQAIAWAPDPAQQSLVLALQQRPHQTYALYRLPVEADTLIQLTDPPAHITGDSDPTFSPSGDRIAFTRTLIDGIQDIHVVSSEGGAPTQVTSDSTRIAGLDWTADGEHLIFASDRGGTSGLWRVPSGGGDPEWITTASEGMQLRYPSLARQGRRLAYAQQSGRVNIWKVQNPMDYSAVSSEQLIASTRWDSNPDIASDGGRVAFVSRRSGYPEVWTASSAGEDLKQVTTLEGVSTQTPRWSPDSRRIAFVARQQGSSDIYVINENGVRPEQITSDPAEDLFPAWSHDGTHLYFTSNRSGRWEIWKIPVDGGSAVQVTYGGATAAQEHPDGSALYVVRSDTTGLWTAPLADTSRTVVVTSSAAASDTTLASDTASVSDAAIALPDTLAEQRRAAPRQVVSALMPYDRANWKVRMRGIYFIRRDPESDVLAFYRFSTDRVTPIMLLRDVPREASFAASPEGDWFVHTRSEVQESDILLVEDLQ